MRPPPSTKDERFEEYDLPLILVTIERARKEPRLSIIEIRIDKDGGLLSVEATHKEKIK